MMSRFCNCPECVAERSYAALNGEGFPVRRVLLVLLALFIVACVVSYLAGCGGAPIEEREKVHIDGGSTQVSDSLRRSGTGEQFSHHQEITITAASQPATQPATSAPVQVEISGKKITAPAGSTVKVTDDQVGTTQPSTFEHERNGIGHGPTYHSALSNDAGNFRTTTPDIGLAATPGESGGADSEGGDGTATWKVIFQKISQLGKLAFIVGTAGFGFIVFAAVKWYFKKADLVTPLLIAGFGILLLGLAVVVDSYPWLLIIAAVLGGIGLLVYVFHTQIRNALGTVITGIEAAPSVQSDAVKTAIDQTANKIAGPAGAASLKRLVTAAKTELKL